MERTVHDSFCRQFDTRRRVPKHVPHTLYTVPAENDSGFFFQCRCPSSGRPCKRKFITNESGFHLYARTRVCRLRSLRRPSSSSSHSPLFPPTRGVPFFFLSSSSNHVVTDRRAAAAAAAATAVGSGGGQSGGEAAVSSRAPTYGRVVVSPDPFAPSCRPTANNDRPSPLQQRRRRRPACDRVVVPAASRVHPVPPPGSVPPPCSVPPPHSIPPGSVPSRRVLRADRFRPPTSHKWPSRVRSDTGSAARVTYEPRGLARTCHRHRRRTTVRGGNYNRRTIILIFTVLPSGETTPPPFPMKRRVFVFAPFRRAFVIFHRFRAIIVRFIFSYVIFPSTTSTEFVKNHIIFPLFLRPFSRAVGVGRCWPAE